MRKPTNVEIPGNLKEKMGDDDVVILGLWSPTSQIGGRVLWVGGVSPTIMAGTHGYGFGCILTYEEDTD